MKVTTTAKIAATDALFVFVPKKAKKSQTKPFGTKIEKLINQVISNGIFDAKKGEIMPVVSPEPKAKKMYLVGLGALKNKEDVRKVAGLAIRKAKKIKAKKAAFLLPKNTNVHTVISGALLGNYEFKIGDTSTHFSPSKLHIITEEKITKKELEKTTALAESTNFVRDLVNLPPNLLTPKILANKAKTITKGIGNGVKVKVLGEKQMQKIGMGSLMGVGQGSHEESQLIIFEYKGGPKNEKPIALVGKGVCFDAGGYNIKPTGHIEGMKSDMTGAATVAGIFQYIAKAKPKKNIIGVIGAVENLINGQAFKPDDIITSMKGSTIEITNTDAEGRLVLADCLYYAATKYKPSKMVDLATLTGACIAALGNEITAVMGNDSQVVKELLGASKSAAEEMWELPITELFREKIKGDIADLVNWTAGVNAGSSMGGTFLEHFVEETPWAHLDIAGTAFHAKSGDEITPKGATGVMMRTLSHWIEN